MSFRIPILALTSALLLMTASGCFIVRPFAGTDFDKEQIARAREAKVMQVRLAAAERLRTQLSVGTPVGTADFVFSFNQEMLTKAAEQLDGTTGWLDSLNSYFLRKVRVTLYHGSAIATLSLAVYNHEHDVNVDLTMDCLLDFEVESGKLLARFEPFSIVPQVTGSGVVNLFSAVIEDLVALKMNEMSQSFPPIELPIEFKNSFPFPGNTVELRSGINMNITVPAQTISYELQLKEIIIFKQNVMVALNLKNAGVVR